MIEYIPDVQDDETDDSYIESIKSIEADDSIDCYCIILFS